MSDQATMPAKTRQDSPSALAPFNRLRDEIDRMIEDFRFTSPARSVFSFASEPRLMPAMELSSHDGGYQLSVELPGLDQNDIEIEFADGVLTVSGEKREESEKKEKGYLLSERRYGSFRRQLTLPADADPASIKADFDKGILKVSMKKDEGAAGRVRKIKIG